MLHILEVVTSTPKLPKSARPEGVENNMLRHGSKDSETPVFSGSIMNTVLQTPVSLQKVGDLEPPSFLADSSDIDVNSQVPPLNLTENHFLEKHDTPEKDEDSMEKHQSDHSNTHGHALQSDTEKMTPILTPDVEELKNTENKYGNNWSPCLTPVIQNDGPRGKLVICCKDNQLIESLLSSY